MIKRMISILGAAGLLLLAGSCSQTPTAQDAPSQADLPNPASQYCVDQGYTLEIVTAADGSQSGICRFPDGSTCEEWAFFRGECSPPSQAEPEELPATETPSPTESPADGAVSTTFSPEDYQGWWTYTHPDYNFTLLLPEDWIVEDISTNDPLLSGHLVNIRPRDELAGANIRVTFKLAGEETLLWPTGVGQGEFVPQGTLEVAGEPVLRYLLVCPSGEVSSIWYHQSEETAAVTRSGIEFGFIFRASSSHCEPGYSLEGKNQLIGEMIISSLNLQ